MWYTGQFYALFFLTITLKMDGAAAYLMIAIALALGTPFFIFFGWLSDRIGRLKIILAGCLIAALTYFPLFSALTHYVNPGLEKFQQANAITVAAKDCNFHIFVGPWSKFTECDRTKDFLTKQGLSFSSTTLPAGSADNVVVKIGETELRGFDQAKYTAVLKEKNFPPAADKNAINWPMTLLILFIMLIYVTMVYGPIAAFLVEMFPTKIRYTSMSLPYHIGNGWFGGMLPLLATAMVAASGDIYYGLWYPIVVALMTFVIGLIFLKDRKDIDLQSDESAYV
jgi:MFS family permease